MTKARQDYEVYREIKVWRDRGLTDCSDRPLTREQLNALVKLAETQIRITVALAEIEAALRPDREQT